MQQAEPVVQTSTGHDFRRAAALPALALAVLVLALQACREDEQDRPFVYDKGTYQGPADEKLEQNQIEALRQRAAGQRM